MQTTNTLNEIRMVTAVSSTIKLGNEIWNRHNKTQDEVEINEFVESAKLPNHTQVFVLQWQEKVLHRIMSPMVAKEKQNSIYAYVRHLFHFVHSLPLFQIYQFNCLAHVSHLVRGKTILCGRHKSSFISVSHSFVAHPVERLHAHAF